MIEFSINILMMIFATLMLYLFVLAIVLFILGMVRMFKMLGTEKPKGVNLISYYLDFVFGDVTTVSRKKIYIAALIFTVFILAVILVIPSF